MTEPGTGRREPVTRRTTTTTTQEPPPSRVVRREDRRRRSPLGWLPWLLAALLLLLLGLMALAALATSKKDDPKGSTSASPSASPSAGASASGGTGGTGGGAAAGGTLTAAGQDLLADPQKIATYAGKPATGTAKVQSVVADEGFWVGNSATDRVFVYLEDSARGSNGESKFQVKEGQTVQLKGMVKPLDAQLAQRIGVEPNEGLAQLEQQKAYVDATEINLRSS